MADLKTMKRIAIAHTTATILGRLYLVDRLNTGTAKPTRLL
jgi:hypothetical protein